jgi:hypothetical protein
MATNIPRTSVPSRGRQSDESRRIAVLFWRAAGVNALGLMALGASVGYPQNRSVVSLVGWTALFVGFMVVGPLSGGVAACKGLNGPAALLAGLAVPPSLLAALVALLSGLFRFWCQGGCAPLSIVGVAVLAAVPIFLAGALFNLVAWRASLDEIARQQAIRGDVEQ